MKIQLFSDLHMEKYFDELQAGAIQVHAEADVVVLAGDIHSGEDAFRFAYSLAQKHGKHVVFVPGNHEYYGHDYARLERVFAASSRDGVHVLLDATAHIDGVRFVGSTLWTDFRLYEGSKRMPTRAEAFEAGMQISDFHRIKEAGKAFTPQRSAERHEISRAYIERILHTPFSGPTVVVTHHAPHEKSIHASYVPGQRVLNSTHKLPNEPLYWRTNVCFASNIGGLVEKADAWFHGHVHHTLEYPVGRGRVYANPRGYPRFIPFGGVEFENPDYDPFKLIVIDRGQKGRGDTDTLPVSIE